MVKLPKSESRFRFTSYAETDSPSMLMKHHMKIDLNKMYFTAVLP